MFFSMMLLSSSDDSISVKFSFLWISSPAAAAVAMPSL